METLIILAPAGLALEEFLSILNRANLCNHYSSYRNLSGHSLWGKPAIMRMLKQSHGERFMRETTEASTQQPRAQVWKQTKPSDEFTPSQHLDRTFERP